MTTLENMSLDLSIEEMKAKLRGGDWNQVQDLLEVAKPLVCGKAFYRVCYVEKESEDTVVIKGMRFTSRVLRKNLDRVGRVFAYVITIGSALEKRADQCADLLEKYYLDMIGNLMLTKARKYLKEHLRSKFSLESLSFMSPGSLEDWPIEEQRPLFSILGDTFTSIGVRLNESLLMIPRKSVSGIYFPTEITFYSCQLCPRSGCVGRKAPYSEKLAKEYGTLE